MKSQIRWMVLVAGVVATAGCTSVYYGTMEKVGVHKRDILVDRVAEARSAQAEAKETFEDALTVFSQVVEVDAPELEKAYTTFSRAYDKADAQATRVRDRIDAIESVSRALFREWKQELKQYGDPELRAASRRQLDDAERRYKGMMKAMRAAEASMEPVLAAFHDQVLFLKHNLNSAAIASLDAEVVRIEGDVGRLIASMEASIAEADAFLAAWPAASGGS